MMVPSELQAQLDTDRRLALPSDLVAHFGLEPDVQVRIDKRSSGLHLRQPVTYLGKVYVEPTSACNLDCRTCIRNVWDEPSGWMTDSTFDRIVQGLRDFSTVPTVFFGGFGEPLAHSGIVDMVAQVKALGAPVTSPMLTTPRWRPALPPDKAGWWSWTVQVVHTSRTGEGITLVTTSREWTFWFGPTPASGRPRVSPTPGRLYESPTPTQSVG